MDYHGHTSSSALLLQHLGFVDDEIYKGELDLPDDASIDALMNERGFIAGCDRPPVDNSEDRSHQRRQSSNRLKEHSVHERPERPFNVPPWKGTVVFCANKRDIGKIDGTGKRYLYGPFGDDGITGGSDDGLETETFEHHIERIMEELNDLENEDENVEPRNPTPALTATSSVTPATETPPPTPSDGQMTITGSEKTSTPSGDLERKRCQAPEQGVTSTKLVIQSSQSGQSTRKRKQGAAVSEKGQANHIQNRSTRKRTKKTDQAFNVNFLLERFGFVALHDDDQTWPCPFPGAAPIESTCQGHFDALGLYEHVSEHVAAFKVHHRGQALECPLKAKMGCNWGDVNRKVVKKIGPNESLARHIVDSHYKARRVQCPCGSIVGRSVLDQIVRHLEGSGHTAKLEKKRKVDPDFCNHPNIANDRSQLLREQKLWEQEANVGTDSNRQEESSKGWKRARHEL